MNQIFSKVFMWLFIGLAITFGTAYYVAENPTMLENVFGSYYWVIIIAELVVAIFFGVRIRKMAPTTAAICYGIYALLTGLTFSIIFIVYEMESIIWVFGITSLVMLIMGAIGYFTKMDLTKFGIYLLMALIAIIIASIVNIFIGSETFDLGICIIGLLIFIAYVAYDVQVIKNKLYGVENEQTLAVYGAFQLYLDFINIFIKLLRLIAKSKD